MLSQKLQLTKQNRKVLAVLLTLILITSGLSAFITYQFAQGQSSSITPQTFTSGIVAGAPSFTIYSDGGVYFAKSQWGANSYYSTDASVVTQDAVSSLGTTGGSITFSSGTFTFSTTVTLTSYITVQGQGYSTTLKPLADISIFTINAPAARITIKNLEIIDYDLHTTTHAAIYLNNAADIISGCTFEHIITFYYATTIATALGSASDISKSVEGCTFNDITGASYTYEAFIFRRVFDCRFYDIFCRAYDANALAGFRFEYAIDSGSSIYGLTCLGNAANQDVGILIDGVSNLAGSGWITDSYKEGIVFQQYSDWIDLSNIGIRSSFDNGIYLNSTGGRVTISNTDFIGNVNYGVRNFNNGGHISLNGGNMYGTSDLPLLVAGDSSIGFYNAANSKIKDYPCLMWSGTTSVTNYGNVTDGLDVLATSVVANTDIMGVGAQVYGYYGGYFSVALYNTTSRAQWYGTANVLWVAIANPT